jgi:hypothetical protein
MIGDRGLSVSSAGMRKSPIASIEFYRGSQDPPILSLPRFSDEDGEPDASFALERHDSDPLPSVGCGAEQRTAAVSWQHRAVDLDPSHAGIAEVEAFAKRRDAPERLCLLVALRLTYGDYFYALVELGPCVIGRESREAKMLAFDKRSRIHHDERQVDRASRGDRKRECGTTLSAAEDDLELRGRISPTVRRNMSVGEKHEPVVGGEAPWHGGAAPSRETEHATTRFNARCDQR